MLNATTDGGTLLKYPNFLETLQAIRPLMLFRLIGGSFYLIGFFLLAYNVWMTIRSGKPVNGTIEVSTEGFERMGKFRGFFNAPVMYCFTGMIAAAMAIFGDGFFFIFGIFATAFIVIIALAHFEVSGAKWGDWHEKLVEHGFTFTVLTIIAAAIGGAIQIIPTVTMQRADNIEGRLQIKYTPLELAGRDIYVSEGCYNCHSQMIRTLVPDVLRYGDNGRGGGYSHLGESIYDHPFQWGSKRTGPDLAREGTFRSDDWHYLHMQDPRDVSPDSNMPPYPHLLVKETKVKELPSKINAMRMLGVPYPIDLSEEEIYAEVNAQAEEIAESLAEKGILIEPEKQIVALIAYLQKLGSYEVVDQGKVVKNN